MASGRIPYAGRRNDPYQREIWQMMRAQMDADQRFYEGDRARSAAKWDAVGNIGAMIEGSYRGFKDREQAEADRDKAEELAKAQAQALIDREQYDALHGQPLSFLQTVPGVIPTRVEDVSPIVDESSYTPALMGETARRAAQPVESLQVQRDREDGTLLEIMQRQDEERLIDPSIALPRPAPGTYDPTMPIASGYPGVAGYQLPVTTAETLAERKGEALLAAEQSAIAGAERELKDKIRFAEYEAGVAADVAETAQGYTVDQLSVRHGFEVERARQAAVDAMARAGFTASQAYLRAQQGFTEIDKGLPHPDPGIEGNVLAFYSKATGPDGNPVIFYPPGSDGQPILLPVEPVEPDKGEQAGVTSEGLVVWRYPDGRLETLTDTYDEPPSMAGTQSRELVGQKVEDTYLGKSPRNEMVDGEITNLSLHGALQSDVYGIAGWWTQPARLAQAAFNTNPEAQKLRSELDIATEYFSTIMTQMGEYRSSSQAVKNVLDRLGNLEGGIFAGEETLRQRANAWLDVADEAIQAHTAPEAIDYDDPTKMTQLYSLITSALYLQDILGMPNRKLIGADFLTPEQAQLFQPGGRSGADSRVRHGALR